VEINTNRKRGNIVSKLIVDGDAIKQMPSRDRDRMIAKRWMIFVGVVIFIGFLGSLPNHDQATATGTNVSCRFVDGSTVRESYPSLAEAERVMAVVSANAMCVITRSGPDRPGQKTLTFEPGGYDLRGYQSQ
jgi:hypothetical protein